MDPIKVTFGALSTAQGDITTTATSMNSRLDDLRRYLAPMVATWEGEAATMYQARQREWDTAAHELNQVLQQVGVALGTANDNYRQVEQVNAARWG
ncbi:MAG TPA: WXG100 family type VII secretion target [Pseudonocardia sp.]|jgi:6 kDa early secretory antigenic target|nr:WXG100 family type VII secretion target [Pseudonocardia sp.]